MEWSSATTVERFTKTEGGVTTRLLEAGSVVVIDGSLSPSVSLKDGEMEESVREAFRQVYAPHKPGDATNQEIFGPNGPKAIGDTWPINTARAAESIKDTGIIARSDKLSGSVSLVAKDRVEGADCLNLLGDFKGEDLVAKDLPPEANVTLRATFHGCYHVDDSSLSFREGDEMTAQMRFTGPKGSPIEGVAMEVIMREKKEELWLALGKLI